MPLPNPAILERHAALLLELAVALTEDAPPCTRGWSPLLRHDVKEHIEAIERAGDPLGIVATLRRRARQG